MKLDAYGEPIPVGARGRKRSDSVWRSRARRRATAEVRERDEHRCRRCGRRDYRYGGDARLAVDHRRPVVARPDLALEPTNRVTLCVRCHGRVEVAQRRGEPPPPFDPRERGKPEIRAGGYPRVP